MKYSNCMSPRVVELNCIGCPSREIVKLVVLTSNDFEIRNLTYPVVPVGPLTLKLISFKVELKVRYDRVEFDSARNMF